MPARPAMATMCTAALVEPPKAICTAMPLANEPRVKTRDGFKSSHTMLTMRSPQSVAMRLWLESIAGMLVEPGRARPNASTMAVMVDAVPMVLHVPGLRVMRDSRLCSSEPLNLPA